MKNLSFIKSTFKFGLLMGIGFCIYTTFMWLTKLDSTYLSIGRYLDGAIILLPIIVIFWAIKHETNSYKVTVLQRFGIAIFISLISFIIYDPFLYVYHHFINPEWFNSVLSLQEIDLKAANVSPSQIAKTLEKARASNVAQSGLFKPSSMIPSIIIVPLIIALLSLIFIRNKKEVRDL